MFCYEFRKEKSILHGMDAGIGASVCYGVVEPLNRAYRDVSYCTIARTAAAIVMVADHRALPAGGTDQQLRRTVPVHVAVHLALSTRRPSLTTGAALRQGASLDLFDLDQRLRLKTADARLYAEGDGLAARNEAPHAICVSADDRALPRKTEYVKTVRPRGAHGLQTRECCGETMTFLRRAYRQENTYSRQRKMQCSKFRSKRHTPLPAPDNDNGDLIIVAVHSILVHARKLVRRYSGLVSDAHWILSNLRSCNDAWCG